MRTCPRSSAPRICENKLVHFPVARAVLQIKDVVGRDRSHHRRDGRHFVQDDQNLLTAFAGPAAVALRMRALWHRPIGTYGEGEEYK